MAQRLPVQRINTGPQALRHAQRKLKLPTYVLANPRSSSLTDTFGGVAYLATGAGISHQAAPSGSWTDFIPVTTNCAVVWMSAMPGSNDVATVTIGGVNAPAVSGNPFVYDATSGYNELQCFVLMNPPTGSKTVTVTFAGANYFHATSVYYSGVGSVGSPTFVTGAAGTQPSMTVTSTLGKFYAQAFAYRPTDGNSTFTDYSGAKQRALFGNPGVGYSQPLTVGDVAGTGADTTISATRNSTSYPWGGVLLPLASTPDPARWANWGTAVISDGRLVTTPSSAYNSGITSNYPYDLTGSSVSIQLVQPPNVGTGSIENGFHIACASGVLKHSFLLSNGSRLHYPDDFNRANGAIGAGWSAQSTPAPTIYNNQMVAPTAGSWAGANLNSWTSTTDHQATLVVGAMVAGDSKIEVMIRQGAGSIQMSWQDGQAPVFAQNPGFTTRATGVPTSFVTGDTIVFSAVGSVYTLTKNGGTVLRWDDTDGLYSYTGASNGVGVGLQTNSANNCGIDSFLFEDVGRTLSFQTTVNGVVSTLASVNYDPVNHEFLRIREAGGTVYYETSEDGSAWDAQTSTPAVFSVSSSYIQIYAGYWGTETAPGVALWDNLNLPVPNPVYMPTKPVSRKTGPMALRQVIRQRPRAGPLPTTSPRQKIATFTETFDVLDPAEWMTVSGSPSADNGLLTLPCASTYSTIMSVDMFDLNESSVYINLDQTQAAGNGTTDTIFAVRDCCGRLAQFMVANGQLITSDTASGYSSTRAYNAAAHQFLRIRANGAGTLYWDISPDASTWTQLATKAGSPFAAGTVQVYLSCGYDGAESNPLPAVFDGINLRPDWPNTRTTVMPVGRKVGPMALRQSRNLRRQQPYPRDIEGIYSADADLDATVELTAEATITTSISASLATTASPVDDVDFSPALLDVAQTITVPGMEQATVTYDATGGGANSGAGTTTSLSWSHTAAAGADVFAFVLRGGGVTTATYDGAAMDYVGTVSLNNDSNNGMLWVFRKSNVAAGTKTVAITFGTATYCSANSVSYLNVGAVTTSGAYAGAALTASQTITGANKCMVVNAISQFCGGVDTFVSSSGGTQRYQGMGSAKYMNLVVQDTDSTGSTVFSSTVTATNTVSGSIGLLLSPTPATTAGVRTVQMLSSAKSNSTSPVGSISWSHNIESDATLLVVGISWLSNNWANPPVCTVNGLTMTRAYAGTWGGAYTGAIEYHYYVNPPSGTQNIVYTGNGNGAYLNVVSLTFKGTKSVGSTSYVANTTSLAVSAVGANDFLFNVWGSWVNGWAGFTGYNQTVLYDEPAGECAVFGYSKGPATFSIQSLYANYGGYGTAVLPIKPQTDYLIDANLAVTVTNTPARPSVNAPYVDAIGPGATGNALSWTHTVGARANLLLVAVNNSVYGAGPSTAYCDGVAMSSPGGWNYGYVALYNYSYLTWWYLWNPTPGAHTITVNQSGNTANSISIANAGGIGSVSNGSAGVGIVGLPDQLMLNMFGGWPSGAGQEYTDYTPATARLWQGDNAGNMTLLLGDWMDPSGTTTFNATNHSYYASGCTVLPIGVARQANTSVNVTATATATAVVNSPVFDSVGAGAASLNTVHSWSHTIASDANCLVVIVGHDGGASGVFSGTVGSSALTYLGTSYEGFDGSNYAYVSMLVCMNPPTGVQTVTVTGSNGYDSANSISYKNVASYGSITKAEQQGGTTAKTLAVTTPSGQLMVGAIIAYNGTLSNFTPTQRFYQGYVNGVNLSLVAGDLTGGTATSFNVTDTNANGYAAIALPLLPAVPIKASLAVTATLTAEATTIVGDHWDADASLVVTATESQTASRIANVNAAQVVTATIDATDTRNQFATSSLVTTATVTDAGNFSPAWTDTSQPVTATLSAGALRAASFDISLAVTASLTGGDKTNQIIVSSQEVTATTSATSTRAIFANASLGVTATITDTATRNANVDSASQAITATQTDVINWSAHADASRAITGTLSSTATRNAIVDAARAVTATLTSAFWQGQRLDPITTAVTATITASETEAATGATPLALTASITAAITKNQYVNTSLPVTASMTASMTKNLFIDADLTAWGAGTFPYAFPILLNAPTADMFLVKGFFVTSVWTVSLDGTITRNVGVNALLSVTSVMTAGARWDSHAETFTVAITATPTAAATRSLSIDAALVITATGTAISSTNHPVDSSLAATAVVSSTVNVDFLIDAPKIITASATTTGIRRQFLDAPLEVTATITDRVKWAAKFQALLSATSTADTTGTRNANVNAPLVITATRDQYLYQTEQFDVILVTTAGLFVLFTINLYGDADLAVTATATVEMTRVSYASAALDVSTDFPVEAVRDQYIDTNLEVQDLSEAAANWDSLAESMLAITADLPILISQGFLVAVSLDLNVETPTEMLLEAILDALLLTESMSLTVNGIRDQYAEALQQIMFSTTDETQWNIKMEAILVVPVSVLADSGSGQAHSNFFVFYI